MFRLVSKVKVRLSLCLTMHHTIKRCWGSGDIAPRIPNLGARSFEAHIIITRELVLISL
jgi:hypothetical protein